MTTLVIVESPTKVKTIGKYLGDDYDVVASVGHIRDLPKTEKGTIDIENDFKPNYVVPKEKEKVVNDIIKRSKKADTVILATDPDREGEAIAWHIKEAAKLKDPKRIVFNEITKDAILKALEQPREIDESLKTSQEARRVLDRLFGYTLSKLIWKKVRYGLSAGRVQSPALRILMEREREIRAFIPETYWEMSAVMKRENGEEYLVEGAQTLSDKKEMEDILKKSKKTEWNIASIKETKQERKPKAPFITSSLQQAANSELSWSPSYTMRVAQKLYEAGLITYMRTDSTHIAKSAEDSIKKHITEEFGLDQYQKGLYKNKGNAQEAHEAIRPTNPGNPFGGKTKEEKKLYDLIYKRTIASHMVSAEIIRTIVRFESDLGFAFVIRGARIVKEGWFQVNPEAKGKENEIPTFTEGEKFICIDVNSNEKETSPPSRYSEAGLVKELESRGIGRPSTYAAIIYTLVDRNYVEKEQRTLIPTDLGDVVSSFLEKHFENYISDDFTATMESTLDKIAEGSAKYKDTLSNFYFPFKEGVDAKEDIEKLTTLGDAPEEFKCPKCDASMIYKLSRTGTFMSCSEYPDCDGARTKEGEIIKDPEEIGKNCPKCEKPLVRRTGRYGDFISCSGYPKCKYIEEDPEEKAKKDTGVKCTDCKKGTMVERRGRFGIFFSCSEYPDCKYAIKAKPTGEKCKECSSLMMEGTKTIPERCSVKTCPMHNPHKL